MGEDIQAQRLQWYAVRIKRRSVGGMRSAVVGAELEVYRDRKGRTRKRTVSGTGARVFVPELLLQRAGFEVFLPVKKVWKRVNRFGPEKALVARPLLVDTLFVGWPMVENRWADLMALDVVGGVIGVGARPIRFPEREMMGLMRRWGGGVLTPEMHGYARSEPTFEPGDVAHVLSGPLDGAQVRIISCSDGVARAVVSLLGRDVEAQVAVAALEGVG